MSYRAAYDVQGDEVDFEYEDVEDYSPRACAAESCSPCAAEEGSPGGQDSTRASDRSPCTASSAEPDDADGTNMEDNRSGHDIQFMIEECATKNSSPVAAATSSPDAAEASSPRSENSPPAARSSAPRAEESSARAAAGSASRSDEDYTYSDALPVPVHVEEVENQGDHCWFVKNQMSKFTVDTATLKTRLEARSILVGCAARSRDVVFGFNRMIATGAAETEIREVYGVEHLSLRPLNMLDLIRAGFYAVPNVCTFEEIRVKLANADWYLKYDKDTAKKFGQGMELANAEAVSGNEKVRRVCEHVALRRDSVFLPAAGHMPGHMPLAISSRSTVSWTQSPTSTSTKHHHTPIASSRAVASISC